MAEFVVKNENVIAHNVTVDALELDAKKEMSFH